MCGVRRKSAVSGMPYLQYEERKCEISGGSRLQYREKVVQCEENIYCTRIATPTVIG